MTPKRESKTEEKPEGPKRFDFSSTIEKLQASVKKDEKRVGQFGLGNTLASNVSTDPNDFILMPEWWKENFGVIGLQFGKIVQIAGDSDTGKCLGRNTPVMLYDGSVKPVQNIRIGDVLMGDDSRPRKVEKLLRGTGPLYRIFPAKGDSFVVNSHHILSLKWTGEKRTRTGKIIQNSNMFKYCKKFQGSWKHQIFDIPLDEYLELSGGRRQQLKCFRVGVDFSRGEIPIDPYILGSWLGDGTSSKPDITNSEKEIIAYWKKYFGIFGMDLHKYPHCETYAVSNVAKGGKRRYGGNKSGVKITNKFLRFLKDYGLLNNKHIPDLYKINSKEVRLKLLAGMIDTDGEFVLPDNCYYITQKSKELAEDIVFLCRSLGFASYFKPVSKKFNCITKGKTYQGVGQYYRISIFGDGQEKIPVLIKRKKGNVRKTKRNALVTGIKKVEYVGRGSYFGFEIDGNGRFLLGDFTVTHNTSLALESMLRAQQQGVGVIYVETEGKTSEQDLVNKGIDPKGIMTVSSAITEEAFDGALRAWSKFYEDYPGERLLLVYDSYGNTVSQRDATIDMTKQDQKPGGAAKTNRMGINTMIARMQIDKVAVLIVNYTYSNIGNPMAKGQVNAGGKALNFFSMLTLQSTRLGWIDAVRGGKNVRLGAKVRWRVYKNHYAKTLVDENGKQILLPSYVDLSIKAEGFSVFGKGTADTIEPEEGGNEDE